jgi:hypothetical protein
MKDIETFLARLSTIRLKYEIQEEAEEQFNVFTALYRYHEEVCLHSRFLSVLLSPESSHKQGKRFLELFLELLEIDFNMDNVEVYPKEADKKEYKNIDILIINRISKQAVIIENKIYAPDSNHEDRGQLEGYFNRICREDRIPKENIKIFYLTLDGHDPTPESLGKYKTLENINGRCISYGIEVQHWIQDCIRECYDKPFLRESLLQYLRLIQKMTNNESTEQEQLDIKNLIAESSNNMKSAKLLFDNLGHVRWHTMSEFWEELSNRLADAGYEVTERPSNENIDETAHRPYSGNYKKNNDYGLRFRVKDGLTLYIWNESDCALYWGGDKNGSYISKEYKERIKEYMDENEGWASVSDCSIFWKYFDLNDKEQIRFQNFSNDGTFNLIDSRYRAGIIERLVKEISDFINQII